MTASIDRYLAHCEAERKLAPLTVAAYRRDLRVLAALAASAGTAVESLGAADVRRFAATLHARGLAPRSMARALSSWRGYFAWRALHEDGGANPVVDVRGPKPGRRLPKALSESMTARLLDAGDRDDGGDEAVRDRAIHELFYSSGLRLAELVGLDIGPAGGPRASLGWIDLDGGEATVTGKGGKRRIVPVGTEAREAIAAWLAVRPRFVKDDPHPLFLSRRGARLAGRTVQSRLGRRAIAAGIPTRVHPHVLRHSFASHLLQASSDLRAVQELLGHASIAATQVYTAVDFKRLAAVYDAAHPRARKK